MLSSRSMRNPCGDFERAFAPTLEVAAVAIELQQWRLTAMQDIDAAFRVAFDGRDGIELHLRRDGEESRRLVWAVPVLRPYGQYRCGEQERPASHQKITFSPN